MCGFASHGHKISYLPFPFPLPFLPCLGGGVDGAGGGGCYDGGGGCDDGGGAGGWSFSESLKFLEDDV